MNGDTNAPSSLGFLYPMSGDRHAANCGGSGRLLGDVSTPVESLCSRIRGDYAGFLPGPLLDDYRICFQGMISELDFLPSRTSPVPSSLSYNLDSSKALLENVASFPSPSVSLPQPYCPTTSQASLGCSDWTKPPERGVNRELDLSGGIIPTTPSMNGLPAASVSPGMLTLPEFSQLYIPADDVRRQSIQTMYQRVRGLHSDGCDSPGRCLHGVRYCSSSASRQWMNRRELRRPGGRNSSPFEMDPRNNNHGLRKEDEEYLAVLRSPEEYTSLDQVKGRMVAIAKTHRGSEFLKERCELPQDLEMVFLEIKDRIFELTRDVFGNGLVSFVLKSCNSTQSEEIVSRLTRQKDQLFILSCDVYGTRVVQELVEVIKSKEEISLVRAALSPRVATLIKDSNGSRVVKCWLAKFKDGKDADANDFLIKAVVGDCVGIANHQHGHAIVKECVDCATGDPKVYLIDAITANALCLSQDHYGNYVLQHVLIQGQPWMTVKVVNELKGNFASLSMHECGSNVVEKCMEFGGEKETTQIIRELLESPCPLQIIDNRYGNYVAQTALECSKGYAVHRDLLNYVYTKSAELSISGYGRNVFKKAKKLWVLANKCSTGRQINNKLSIS